MDKDKLNKKLLEFAGFRHPAQKECGDLTPEDWWRFPTSHIMPDSPDFPNDLNACFKWLVPKLQEGGYGFTLCDSQGKPPYFFELYSYQTMFPEAHAGDAEAETPSLALCLAIEKLIDSEVSSEPISETRVG